jgi:hypothetical protein
MIEFRAACGHSVRAKDSDAGKTVKCTYCGKMVQVPYPDDASDELFAEAQAAPRAAPRPVTPRTGRRGVRAPTGLVKILLGVTYLGVAVVAVALGIQLVMKRFGGDRPEPQTTRQERRVSRGEEPGSPGSAKNPYKDCRELKMGEAGLVLLSVPSGARIYLSEVKDGESLEANPTRNSELLVGSTPKVLDKQKPGRYRIGFEFSMSAPPLQGWPGYREFRVQVQEKGRSDVDYFVYDDADEVGISDRGYGPPLIYRTYEAMLRNKEWSSVIALFVPDQPVEHYLGHAPKDKLFEFDSQYAEYELKEIYGVKEDAGTLIRALRLMGKVVWPTGPQEPPVVFQVQPNGEIWPKKLRSSRAAVGESSPLAIALR